VPEKVSLLGKISQRTLSDCDSSVSSRSWCVLLAISAAIAAPRLVNTNPTLTAPYTATVFATAPGGSTAPDSIAVDGNNVWIGFGYR